MVGIRDMAQSMFTCHHCFESHTLDAALGHRSTVNKCVVHGLGKDELVLVSCTPVV